MQVNNNGVISFSQPVLEYTPVSFPLGSGLQLISPYWADVDTRGTGTVWFRDTTNLDILRRTMRDVQMAFANQINFQPLFAFIATWDRVGYFSNHTDLVSICIGTCTHNMSIVLYTCCIVI